MSANAFDLHFGMTPANYRPLTPVSLQARAAAMMMGRNIVVKVYFKNSAATQDAFEGGWFHRGDLAVMYPDGYCPA